MKIQLSSFLKNSQSLLAEVVTKLSAIYDYVSMLGTDVQGTNYEVTTKGANISESIWTQRGCVVRIQKDHNIREYSFNCINGKGSDELCEEIEQAVSKQEAKGMSYSDKIFFARSKYEGVEVSKLFLSPNKTLTDSFYWSQGYIICLARENSNTRYMFSTVSGRKGAEVLNELSRKAEHTAHVAVELLEADRIEPGAYEVILSPDVGGTLAHEAFGHGVEADMMVRDRAKAHEFMAKPIASSLVTMHDGALAADQNGSYLFGDEVELHSLFRFADYVPERITEHIIEMRRHAKQRARAHPLPDLGKHDVVLTGEAVRDFFEYYKIHVSAEPIYQGISQQTVGSNIQGEPIYGDALPLWLDPNISLSPDITPYDEDGIVCEKVQLIRNGEVVRIAGGTTPCILL